MLGHQIFTNNNNADYGFEQTSLQKSNQTDQLSIQAHQHQLLYAYYPMIQNNFFQNQHNVLYYQYYQQQNQLQQMYQNQPLQPLQRFHSLQQTMIVPKNNKQNSVTAVDNNHNKLSIASHSLFDKYSPIELIGNGTFGNIWKVLDIHSSQTDNLGKQKQYALKTIKYDTNWSVTQKQYIEKAFVNEARRIIYLNNIETKETGKHFIIKCKEILYIPNGNNNNNIINQLHAPSLQPCIVLELFGHSLLEYMMYNERKHLKITLETIRCIAIQLFSAMSFIHGIGECIHCDLKPENILIAGLSGLTGFPEIKIIDFGNCMPYNREIKSFDIQTLWYRAPEVLFGNKYHISSLIDMWSIGCILYELSAFTINQNGKYGRLFETSQPQKSEVIHKIYNEMLPFPNYVYNKTYSNYMIEQSISHINIYHSEFSYFKLKIIRQNKLICKLFGDTLNLNNIINYNINKEFICFVDLLSCLLDLNPLTRYSSEDAIRHKFTNKEGVERHIHPIIKLSDDKQRQLRINTQITDLQLSFVKYNHLSACTKRDVY